MRKCMEYEIQLFPVELLLVHAGIFPHSTNYTCLFQLVSYLAIAIILPI